VDRLERLVNLVAALIDTERPLTRADIAERIEGYSSDPEAFRRNFERDKDLLRQMGFPLVTESPEGTGSDSVGYRIPRELYELPDPGLSEEELTTLRLAASVVALEGEWSVALVSALRKLGGAVPGAGGGAGESGAEGPEGPAGIGVAAAALPAAGAAAAAFAAVSARQRIQFRYRGITRRIDPWRLSFQRGHWYLSGWDHARGAERRFRLDRVEGDVAAIGDAGAFERPAHSTVGPPPPWRMGDEEETAARLWVDAERAGRAAQALGDWARAEPGPDGSVVFTVGVTNRRAFIGFVLGWLDHAELLGPADLRAELVAWLAALP
jgi:proteasome accessory factor B